MLKNNFILGLLLPLILGIYPVSVYAQDSIINQIINTQPSIVEIKAENSNLYKGLIKKTAIDPKTGKMVMIRGLKKASYDRDGAGVIIHPSGIIITNSHTVNKADFIKIKLNNGNEFNADVIRVIHNLDLAMLKINSLNPLPAVSIANSDNLKLGDEIITVGNSSLLKQTVSGGKIIGLGSNKTKNNRIDLIHTSFNVYEGDSGGPIFDKHGRLIGLMVAKETGADHSSFAIPSNKINKYLEEYLNK